MTGHYYVWAVAALIAIAFPLIVIAIRGNIRAERIGIIIELEKAFQFPTKNPSLELVKSKYDQAENKIKARQLIFSAIPYMMISTIGIGIILTPVDTVFDGTTATRGALFHPLLFMTNLEKCPPLPATQNTLEPQAAPAALPAEAAPAAPLAMPGTVTECDFADALTILAFTFAGGILFSLHYLLRAVTNFELGPLTFLRVTVHMLFALATVMALWRFSPDLPMFREFGSAWYIIGFAFGFFPEFGLRYVLSRLPLYVKGHRQDLLPKSPIVPIQLIDGIDAGSAFRLEELVIYDVQNLATFNPILLHVETPFGFYESIDWVAQAQLCTIVGPEAFLDLRLRNIRTIFDLERATLHHGSSPAIRRGIADIVMPPEQKTAGHLPEGQAPIELSDDDLVHLFTVMMDDLHVHRLRQVWETVVTRLGTQFDYLSPLGKPLLPK
ncbi:hypothetical protein EV667_0518 [Ancylobacter aquaticus]|uniref:Uncharacterized protein n=1 Tax=Ancylobacter aquaticus TaxID=100 RepID=A0A4R1I665_ANCAQ|nr:hypothetical protein [Ancylobacter aquaticus]TCK30428.1 hypothetical protein EV667_0518 [Ancylobacter aquaticus]